MGLFNTLFAEIPCPDCGKKHEARIQFKFGHTRQLQYRIGDTITWKGGNDIGSPDLNEVKAYGIIESETCPYCGKNNLAEEYDIFFKENVIINVSIIACIEDYLIGNGEYVPLNSRK